MVDKRNQEELGARAALVVLVDLALRRHDPKGPGEPCRDKLSWIREMLEARLDAFKRRRLELPAPVVVADSWFDDSKSMMHVGLKHQGTLLVEGKSSYVFALADGRQVQGGELLTDGAWPWRDSSWECRVRYARLRAEQGKVRRCDPAVAFSLREQWLEALCP